MTPFSKVGGSTLSSESKARYTTLILLNNHLTYVHEVFCISPMRGVELNEHLNEFFGWLDEHLSACLTELSGFRTKGRRLSAGLRIKSST